MIAVIRQSNCHSSLGNKIIPVKRQRIQYSLVLKSFKDSVILHMAVIPRSLPMAVIPMADHDFIKGTRHSSPAHFLTRIEPFSLFTELRIQNYESVEFTAGDYKWKLVICPKGQDDESELDDHISAYLAISQTSSLPVDWEVNAMFTIFLYNQVSDNYLCFQGKAQRFHAMKPEWGLSKLISKKCLLDPSNGYIVDDSCVCGAEVFVIKSTRIIERLSLVKDITPYKLEWEISSFSRREGVCTSVKFNVGGFKWTIRVFPSGNASEKGQNVSIFLHPEDLAPPKRVKVAFCVSIKNHFYDETLHKEESSYWFTSTTGWGWPAFAPLADVLNRTKGYILNDCCIIKGEVAVHAIATYAPAPK